MDYFSTDTESTGLNLAIVLPIEISMLFETPNDQKSYEEIPKFKAYIKWPYYPFELVALKMNQNVIDILNNEPGTEGEQHLVMDNEEVVDKICSWLESLGFKRESPNKKNPKGYYYINFAGKNVSFDLQLLEKLPGWKENIKVRHRVGDPNVLYVNWYADKTFPNLSTCKERAELGNTEVLHNSDSDAWDVIEVLRKKYGPKPNS